MSRTSINESGVVINVAEEIDTIDDIFAYVSQHIDSWVDSDVLWDLSLFDFQTLDSKDIRNLIQKGSLLSKKRLGLKTAFLVTSDLGYGMMRMLQIMAEGELKFEIGVFRSNEQDQALAWLSK